MDEVVPCAQDAKLKQQIEEFAETLKIEAHKLGTHGISERDFYRLGIFQGAIERIRGQHSAEMIDKRAFVSRILGFMQDNYFIQDWQSASAANRHDYTVTLINGRISVIELKGCLDGNGTTIFERPAHAEEFIIWSVCSNAGADPRKNVWSGIHTRLSPEIIENKKQVDGLIVWDWLCGTLGRPCPKLAADPGRTTVVGQFKVPPPCIYLFPRTIPSVPNNSSPEPHKLDNVGFLKALHQCFGGRTEELHEVQFNVANAGTDLVRSTTISRHGHLCKKSKRPGPIRRK